MRLGREYGDRNMIKKVCLVCNNEFLTERNSTKYCSHYCYSKTLIGNRINLGKKNALGAKHSELSKQLMREKMKDRYLGGYGKEHWGWKGNNVGYRALHSWVIRKLGKATKCEFCGKEKTTPKSIHWANKSHKYKRSLSDWIQLCVPCHKAYDRV